MNFRSAYFFGFIALNLSVFGQGLEIKHKTIQKIEKPGKTTYWALTKDNCLVVCTKSNHPPLTKMVIECTSTDLGGNRTQISKKYFKILKNQYKVEEHDLSKDKTEDNQRDKEKKNIIYPEKDL